MTSPTDRNSDAYRARIRELAQTKRRPPRDRKRRNSHAPDRRPYPWVTDLEVSDPD